MIEQDHLFDAYGYDVWGYDRQGHYSSAHDRRPFQSSPFDHCKDCDNLKCGIGGVERD